MSKATQTDAMGSIQRGVKRAFIRNYFSPNEVSEEWSYILSSSTYWI